MPKNVFEMNQITSCEIRATNCKHTRHIHNMGTGVMHKYAANMYKYMEPILNALCNYYWWLNLQSKIYSLACFSLYIQFIFIIRREWVKYHFQLENNEIFMASDIEWLVLVFLLLLLLLFLISECELNQMRIKNYWNNKHTHTHTTYKHQPLEVTKQHFSNRYAINYTKTPD